MRTLVASLLIPFCLSTAWADAPAPESAAPPAAAVKDAPKLVGVILSTSQALLWDEQRGEYVIKRVGESVDGARIVALAQDRVVLDRNGARETLGLSAAPTTHVQRPQRMPAMIVNQPAAPVQPAPPAAPSSPAAPSLPAAPSSPAAPTAVPAPTVAAAPAPVVAAPAPVAATPAPVVATPTPIAAAPAPVVATPAPVAAAPAPVAAAPAPVVAPYAPAAPAAPAPVAAPPAPAVAATPAPPAAPSAPVAPPPGAIPAPYAPPSLPAFPAPPPTVAQGPILIIPRDAIDRELGDFTALASEVTVSPGPRGGFQLANLRTGSFLERIGLRSGDTVLRVDGRPINAAEDASAAYAWLRVTDHFTVDLVRNGRPVQLRYVIAQAQTASN